MARRNAVWKFVKNPFRTHRKSTQAPKERHYRSSVSPRYYFLADAGCIIGHAMGPLPGEFGMNFGRAWTKGSSSDVVSECAYFLSSRSFGACTGLAVTGVV